MSIFTGIFARHRDAKLPPKVVEALRASVSRSKEDADTLIDFSDDQLYMVKADIGAYGEPGVLSEHDQQGFVAGAPIIQRQGNGRILTRSEELRIIANDVVASRTESLRSCRGQYCAAVYEHAQRALHLVVDKLGVRPIYCWISPDYVVFSTAMRIIEGLEFCTKSISLRGVAEYAAFGYPLSDRTTYENVIALHAGEIISFSSGAIKRQRYWRWDNLPPPQDEYPDAETRIYETFREGVRLRLRNDRTTTAFLSGGLDSRSIVAMLRTFGAEVLSVSFGPSGSQDQAFATLAAERLGARHTQIRTNPLSEGDSFSKATLLPWIQSPAVTNANVERPRLLWSGDGGSVGLGHVYLNEEMVRLTRTGDMPAAAQSYLSHNRFGVHTRLLKPAVAAAMKHAVKQGIEEELNSLRPADAGRTMHLYLMLNDQRRHLAAHFENIDLGRVDFHEPFFDAGFLAAILHEPIDPFLRHRFYVGWLKKFPSGVLEAPWQAYPNHVPCPVPAPAGLSYQWSENNNEESNRSRRTAIAQAQTIMSNNRFADEYVQKPYLHGVRLLLQAGLRKREYWLHTVSVLHKYWNKAGNNQQI